MGNTQLVEDENREKNKRARDNNRVLLAAAATAAVLVVGVFAMRSNQDVPSIKLAENSSRSADSFAASSSTRAWGGYSFTLEDGIEIEGSDQSVWRWDAPTESDVRVLASRLGAEGPVLQDNEFGAMFQAGNLTVMSNGSWSYYDGEGATAAVCAVPAVSPDSAQAQAAITECVIDTPPPAVGLPTDSKARDEAFEVLGEGFRISNVTRSEWNVTVDGTYIVEGESTNYWASVTFAGHGTINSASGMLGRPSYVGKYRTISASDALGRLEGVFPMAYDGARALAATTNTAVTCPQDTACDAGVSSEALPGCGVSDCTEPELCSETESCKTSIVLTGVRRSITLLYDSSSIAWVVPAYEFVDLNGGVWTAMALDDSYLEKADVSTEPGNAVTPVDPAPEPLPAVTGGGSLGTVPTFDTSSVVGLTENAAVKLIESKGFSARVVSRDAEVLPVTMDYRLERVNISVEQGSVVSANIG